MIKVESQHHINQKNNPEKSKVQESVIVGQNSVHYQRNESIQGNKTLTNPKSNLTTFVSVQRAQNPIPMLNPPINYQTNSNTIPPKQQNVQSFQGQLTLITPSGILVFTNSNPVSRYFLYHFRYNHAIKQYNHECNVIRQKSQDGQKLIELTTVLIIFIYLKIPQNCLTSKIYDAIIYIWDYGLLTFSGRNEQNCSCFKNLIIIAIYLCVLILPYISLAQFVINALFFLYYIIGVIIFAVNACRLGSHEFTQNMLKAQLLWFYDKSWLNNYYDIHDEKVIGLNAQVEGYKIIAHHRQRNMAKFMAYTHQFLDYRYYYIVSCKIIAYQILIILLSASGFTLSIIIFPTLYGR